jgi:hypothetical protein
MVDELGVGDEVLTAGGFFATVRPVTEDEVVVELAPDRGPPREARDRRVLPPEDASRRKPCRNQPGSCVIDRAPAP